MKVDVKAIEGILRQAISLSNLGIGVATSVAGLVDNVVSALKAKGYEQDSEKLAEVIADATRRLKTAEHEARAEE